MFFLFRVAPPSGMQCCLLFVHWLTSSADPLKATRPTTLENTAILAEE
jgi:hypothetical protein